MCLDLSSSSTGYVVMQEGDPPHLLGHGTVEPFKSAVSLRKAGIKYPWTYVDCIDDLVTTIDTVVRTNLPLDAIVVEETNKGRNRYSQKLLEFLHHEVLKRLRPLGIPIHYVSTSTWRSTLGIGLSKDDKRNNAKVSEAKRKGVSKKSLGVKGRIGKKHVAIRYVNEVYPHLDLKMKDNDVADAIALGLAFVKGARTCDGT